MILTAPVADREPAPAGRRFGPALVALGLGAGGVAIGSASGSPLLVAGVPLAVIAIVRSRRTSREERARRDLRSAVPAFIDGLTQRLRSGASLGRAITETEANPILEAELGPLRAGLLVGLGLGHSLDSQRHAMATMSATGPRDRAAHLSLLIGTITVLARRGGPAVATLERLSDTVRSAEAIEADVAVQAGQATASASLLAALPAIFVLTLALADGRIAHFYLFDSIGSACLIVSGVLSYAGRRWMVATTRRITQRPAERRTRRLLRRATETGDGDLPEAIDLCRVVLGAGGTIRDCIDALAEHGPPRIASAATHAIAKVRDGARVDEALRHIRDELGPGYQPLTGALLLAREHGGTIGELLARLSVDAGASRRRRGGLAARKLPVALLAPLVLCSLPAVVIGALLPVAIVALRAVAF